MTWPVVAAHRFSAPFLCVCRIASFFIQDFLPLIPTDGHIPVAYQDMAPGQAEACLPSGTMRVYEMINVSPQLRETVWERQWYLTDCGDSQAPRPGDIIFIPDLMTGGGDFEGVFFAGPETPQGMELISTDAETLLFPGSVQALVAARGSDMVATYRRAAEFLFEELELEMEDWFEGPNDMAQAFNQPDHGENIAYDLPPASFSLGDVGHRILLEYPLP